VHVALQPNREIILEFRWKRFLLAAFLGALWCACARADDLPSKPMSSAQQRALGFLKSLPREWSGTSDRDCKTYADKNIDQLVGSFAISAAAFLKAFIEVHGQATITSAYRSIEEQACVCEGEKGPCAGRPFVIKTKKGERITTRKASHHEQGIALDVRAGTGTEEEFACMHEFAQFNPQFGVRFPMGKHDQPHMEPSAEGEKNVRLAALGAAQRPIVPCAKMKIMLTEEPVD
jgi:hypothetical protein